MQPSDFSSVYMPIVRLLPSWAGPVCWPDTDEISQVPPKGLHHVHIGSPTARGSSSASHLRGEDVAFRPTVRRQHLEIRPVSQLHTSPGWPSGPRKFHPEPLTEPDVTLSRHPARATAGRLPPPVERWGSSRRQMAPQWHGRSPPNI